MAGKTQGAWQWDEGDGVLELILGALCAQSFFTLKGEAFESEEGDTVSDSSRCTDSEGTATASVSWSRKRERLKNVCISPTPRTGKYGSSADDYGCGLQVWQERQCVLTTVYCTDQTFYSDLLWRAR